MVFLSFLVSFVAMSGKDKGYEFSRLVRISGEDATPTDGASSSSAKTNFTVDFGYNLQQVKRVSILNVSFLNTAFNLIEDPSSRANVHFTISILGSVNTYTVDPGFYDLAQLLTVLNSALADFKTAHPTAPVVVFAQSAVSGFVTATGSGTATVLTIFDSDASGNPLSRGPIELIGFAAGTISITQGQVITATQLPHLQGLTEAYIVSQALAPGNCFDEKNQVSSILAVVPITAPFGQLNVFECKQDVLCEVSYPTPRNIQKADFSLRDRFGALVDLNGSNLKLTLRVWYNSY